MTDTPSPTLAEQSAEALAAKRVVDLARAEALHELTTAEGYTALIAAIADIYNPDETGYPMNSAMGYLIQQLQQFAATVSLEKSQLYSALNPQPTTPSIMLSPA